MCTTSPTATRRGACTNCGATAKAATGTTNLTANANAPTASGHPFAYVDTARNTEILLFRGGDGTVRSLYWSTGAVGHDNLGGTAGAPKASGDPVGYYDAATDGHHVVYRGGDGHLHEMNWFGVAPVSYGGNLTGAIGAPRAVGNPSGIQRRRVQHRRLPGHQRPDPLASTGTTVRAGSTICQARQAHPRRPAIPPRTTPRTTTRIRSTTARATGTSTSCTGPVSPRWRGGT